MSLLRDLTEGINRKCLNIIPGKTGRALNVFANCREELCSLDYLTDLLLNDDRESPESLALILSKIGRTKDALQAKLTALKEEPDHD